MKINAISSEAREVSQILLDGFEITSECMEADDEAGEVLVVWRKPNGQIAQSSFGGPLGIRKHGKVEIKLKPKDAARASAGASIDDAGLTIIHAKPEE